MPATALRTPTMVITLVVLAAVYWPGLSGPFVLDDHGVLASVWAWLSGQRDYLDTLLHSKGSALGRPLSLLTLMANGRIGGDLPFGFKLTNLALHATNGLLALALLRRVGDQVPAMHRWLALALVALWWLHPWHVGTVLYTVQRMALLGATAQLVGLLVYLEGRAQLAHAPTEARALLFVAFPVVTAVGVLAKETAALTPLLCLVLEFTLFAGTARPREVKVFHALFTAAPLVAGAAAGAIAPERIFGDYVGREFTMAERLLTQPRVLLDYMAGWFWPGAAQGTMYRDGYPLSTGLLQPGATLMALTACGAAIAAAMYLRRRRPLFALGVLWFFAAHALESGPFALEPYFSHRNYLASLGLMIALTGLLPLAPSRFRPIVWIVAVVAVGLGLAAATRARSSAWADLDRHLAYEAPPADEVSPRLQLIRAIRADERGDAGAVDAALAPLLAGSASQQALAAPWAASLQCKRDGRIDARTRDALMASRPPVLTHLHVTALDNLAATFLERNCDGLDLQDLIDLGGAWQDSVTKRPRAKRQDKMTLVLQRLKDRQARAAPPR